MKFYIYLVSNKSRNANFLEGIYNQLVEKIERMDKRIFYERLNTEKKFLPKIYTIFKYKFSKNYNSKLNSVDRIVLLMPKLIRNNTKYDPI